MSDDEKTVDERIQELEDQMKTFRENPFLRSLPGRIIGIEAFAETVCSRQEVEELKRFLHKLEGISTKRWDDAFPLRSIGDLESLARLRRPLNDFLHVLRDIRDRRDVAMTDPFRL